MALHPATSSLLVRHVLPSENSLLTASRDNVDDDAILILLEGTLDVFAEFAIGETQVILLLEGFQVQKGSEPVLVHGHQLVLLALDDGHVHVVGRRADVLKLLVGEDVQGNHVNLSVSMLAGLRGRHLDNLARAVLDHDVFVLADGGALLWVGGGGARVSGGEFVIVLVVRHLWRAGGFQAKIPKS